MTSAKVLMTSEGVMAVCGRKTMECCIGYVCLCKRSASSIECKLIELSTY